MKRAWVTIQEWEGRQVGQIERISNIESWSIFCVNHGWVIPVDFDDTVINENYAIASLVNDVWTIIEDTAKKENDTAIELANTKIQVERLNMENGQNVLAYFNVLTEENNYGLEEFQSLLSNPNISMAKELLRSGAIQASYAFISAITPDSVFTETFKNSVLTKIQSYIGG